MERPGAKNEEIWQKVKHRNRNFFIVNMTDKLIYLNENSTPDIRLKGIHKR